ncbi:tagaturonate reductase [Algibacter sp.]|uniref:tagaturonate reductase n=1 Tax=Algibacter sp. TaxID=1872428 RepID=UPI003C76C1C3
MNVLNRETANLKAKLPIKIVQFGEGNFLRAFIEYAFQELNKAIDFNAGIAVVQPIEKGMIDLINNQDGLYTLFMKGVKKGKEIQEIELIENIVKGINPYSNFNDFIGLAKEEDLEFIFSNTTEAGIAYDENDTLSMQPPNSFPAKLTVLLYERYKYFKGDLAKGLRIIPCELINYNAKTLKEIILKYSEDWKLEPAFNTWLLESCSFHNTLVDRIVPGYPSYDIDQYNAQLPYKDNLIVTAESFFLWVIEGGDALKAKLPFDKTHLDVKIVDDLQPYRTRKVRILNGAHTAMVPLSLLYGNTTVKQTVDHKFTGEVIHKAVFEEIIDTLEMDNTSLNNFAEEVFDRFRNPFIVHNLSSIALNSISKFKVRVLPSLLQYVKKNNKLPLNLTFAFACLIRYYKGVWKGETLPVQDSDAIIADFLKIWATNNYTEIANAVLSSADYWGEDLTKVENLSAAIILALKEMDENGIEKGYSNYANQHYA